MLSPIFLGIFIAKHTTSRLVIKFMLLNQDFLLLKFVSQLFLVL